MNMLVIEGLRPPYHVQFFPVKNYQIKNVIDVIGIVDLGVNLERQRR